MLKFLPKILITFFLTIFIFQLASLIFLFALPQASLAADPATFKPQVEIPGLGKEFNKGQDGGYILPQDTGGIAKYIRAIYKYAIGIVGILAAVVLMIGGVMWIMAGGSATMIGEAKAWIGASLTGLTLALLSYLILATANPALVDLKTTAIKPVAPAARATNFDANTACGQQVQGQNITCGSKCPAGQTCKKVQKETVNARKCPETLSDGPNTGSGDYYLCDSSEISCCDNENNSPCKIEAGYVCNTRMIASICPNGGICALKQGPNGPCSEDDDCISNNCIIGILLKYRCQ